MTGASMGLLSIDGLVYWRIHASFSLGVLMIFVLNLTHRPHPNLDKIPAISQTVFAGAFSWMKIFDFD